jgi:hypothetical protein
VRVLFFLRSVNYGRHFENLLEGLLAGGHEVEIAFDRTRKGLKADESVFTGLRATHERLSWHRLPEPADRHREAVAERLRYSIDFLRYGDRRYAEAAVLRERARERAPHPLVRLTETVPGTRRALDAALRRLEAALPPDPAVADAIRRAAPDVVLVSPLVSLGSRQGEAVRAARAAGIPVALPVASWDNLTNKGVIRDAPDLVLVWNAAQVREAVDLHGLRAETIVATGAHNFDQWFRWAPSTDREAFCAEAGLDPERPFLLYAGSSAFIAPDEPRFFADWLRRLRSSGDPALRDAGVLVRPHPANPHGWAALDVLEPGRTALWPPVGEIPTSAAAKRAYYDSIHHAQAVVGINTSALIESAIVGRGVFTVVTDAYRDTQEGTLHFGHLTGEQGLLNVARSWDEHLAQLAAVLADDAAVRERTAAFVRSFVRPHGLDVEATGRAVAEIERLAARARAPRPAARADRAIAAGVHRPLVAAHRALGRRPAPGPPVRVTRRVAPGPGAALRFLVVADRPQELGGALEELAGRGHTVEVAAGRGADGYPPARRRKGAYARVAPRVRRAVDAAAAARRPWLLRALRRLEQAIPTDPTIDRALARRPPDALLLAPVPPRELYPVDYLRSARALGIPTALWANGGDPLRGFAAAPDRVVAGSAVADVLEEVARAAPAGAPARRPADALLRAALRLGDWR